eukprot:9999187-Lingulodinium_polyedra.AAC.1
MYAMSASTRARAHAARARAYVMIASGVRALSVPACFTVCAVLSIVMLETHSGQCPRSAQCL